MSLLLLVFYFLSLYVTRFSCEEGMSQASYMMLKAAEDGDTEKVIEYITVKHVDKKTRNNYGVSPIIFAGNNGHVELLKALVGIGDDIEDRSNNGRTPLHWASLWGHLHIVEYLVGIGANISSTDVTGMTPLMCAVYNNQSKVASYLLQHGADATVKNNYGGTCMSIALVQQNQPMIDFLQPYFLNSDTELSPYDLAIKIVCRESKIFYQVLVEEFTKLYQDFCFYAVILQEFFSVNVALVVQYSDAITNQIVLFLRCIADYSIQLASNIRVYFESVQSSESWKATIMTTQEFLTTAHHRFLTLFEYKWGDTFFWKYLPDSIMTKTFQSYLKNFIDLAISKAITGKNMNEEADTRECATSINDPTCVKSTSLSGDEEL